MSELEPCERESQKVMAALWNYVDSFARLDYVQKLKPTERKGGEEERAQKAFSRYEDGLYEALKTFKKCKV